MAEMDSADQWREFARTATLGLAALRPGRTAALGLAALPPTQNQLAIKPEQNPLEDGIRNSLAQQQWGKDMPWYLPRELVGDTAYRYQGVALHGALAALAARYRQALPFWGNAGYVGYSLGSGRTQRPEIGKDGIPILPEAPY